MPIHNEAQKGEIAKTVLMPGDPIRAKYIAETYLDDYKLVNKIRGMYAYTGKYKGKEITVMASGMGMASIGIYANELYDYYDVDNIIRIGTCGVFDKRAGLLDVLLVDGAYNEGNFAYNYDDDDIHWAEATKEINDTIAQVAANEGIKFIRTNIASTECFDPYQPHHAIGYLSRLPKDKDIVVSYGKPPILNESEINHYCSTKEGSSGSPILLINNQKLIGIHYGHSKQFNFNKGELIKY